MKAIQTEHAPVAIGTYSQAILQGNTVYFSGQLGLNPKTGQLVSDDFLAQTKQAFDNLSAVARAAHGELKDIVKLTIYVTDLNDVESLNTFMAERFAKPYPARTIMQAQGLPRQSKIAVEAIMVLPSLRALA